MNKKFVNSVLACAMTVSTFSIGTVKAEEGTLRVSNENLALKKEATASNSESVNPANKAVDGNLSTHWGTDAQKAKNEWLSVNLGGEKTVKQINVFFERKDNEQNILSYKVDLKVKDKWETVFTSKEKVKQKEVIVLENSYIASEVRVTILEANGGTLGYVNAGISELEVYSNVKENADETANKNHMLDATVSAESTEVNSLSADKVKDGNADTRWASGYKGQDSANSALRDNVWLKADFDNLKKVKEIQVDLFTRDVEPMPTNVKSFDIYYTDASGKDTKLQTYTNSSNKTKISIVLNNAIEAKSIKLCNFTADNCVYNNISINELRVFSNEQSAVKTLDQVVEDVKNNSNKTIEGTEFGLPAVPEGITIEFNGADFEQIVGKTAKENGVCSASST